MPVLIFDDNDYAYFRWLNSNKSGYVINTPRTRDPAYMLLHRASCHSISEYAGNAAQGGFTERDYIKICATDIESLRNWVKQNGRPDGSFSKECQFCSPLDTWDDDDDWLE